jgi:hypothetical protein
MARRWRRVYTNLYHEARFRALSAPSPNAQTLFLYLKTGPETTLIPGLVIGGQAALAEALGWPLPAFRRAFRELEVQGFARADWSARLVFLPAEVSENQPENPNVAKAWRSAFDELPECALRKEAFESVRTILEPLGERFGEPFAQPLQKGLAIQEQEQEQKQEQKQEPPLTPRRRGEGMVEHLDGFETFWKVYPRKAGKEAARKAWAKLAPENNLVEIILAAVERQKTWPAWTKDGGQYIPHPGSWLGGRRWEDEPPYVPPARPSLNAAFADVPPEGRRVAL